MPAGMYPKSMNGTAVRGGDAERIHELQLWDAGYRCVAGVDEAGRGAWAGPVYAGAVVLSDDPDSLEYLLGCVDDSKKLTPSAREYAFGVILAHARYAGVGAASNDEIDQLGIAPATRLAWRRALDGLRKVDYLLLDAFRLPESDLPQLPWCAATRRAFLSPRPQSWRRSRATGRCVRPRWRCPTTASSTTRGMARRTIATPSVSTGLVRCTVAPLRPCVSRSGAKSERHP